jgi:hypothetical protein
MAPVKAIDIRGRAYVTVAERVRILHEMRKAGELQDFEMVESQPFEIAGQPYWRVSARIDGKLYIGNAEIKLNAAKNSPDGTNPIACAETSAFGRMLAFAGLGTIDSIASADEVVQTLSDAAQTQPDGKLLPAQFNALKSLYVRLKQDLPKDLAQWTFVQARETIASLQAQLKAL